MASVSIVLLICSGFFVTVGLVPCLGWVNWVTIPICALTAMSGIIGLFSDRDPATQQARGVMAHALALAIGGVLILVAILRCTLGGGVV